MASSTDYSDMFMHAGSGQNINDTSVDYNLKLLNVLYPSNVHDSEVRSITKEISFGEDDTRLQELYNQIKQPWYARAFSPLTPGSLRGSMFTLISSALGAGILALPHMYKNTGLVLGTVFLIVAALTALWSMYLLSKCSFRTSCYRYSDAVLQLLGERWNLVLQIVLIIYVFGALVSYLITLNQFIAGLVQTFGFVSFNWSNPTDPHYNMTYIVIGALAILAFPLASVKNLSGLRHLTIFSVIAITYIIVTIVWQAPVFYAGLYEKPLEHLKWVNIGLGTISGWANCAFAFACHVNVFPVVAELQHPMEKRTNKIFNRCISVETIMYLCIGIGGYMSTLDQTPNIFTSRVLPPNVYVGPNDIFMTIGKIAMTLNLFFVIPVNLNPCRLQLITLFSLEDFKRKNALHYGLTLMILLAAAGTAMVIPNISVVFDVLGGFFATMLSYTFPAMIYLKCTNMRQGHYKRWIVYLIAAGTTIAGFASGFLGLFKAFKLIDA